MMIEFADDLMRIYTLLDVEQHSFSGQDEHGAAMVMPTVHQRVHSALDLLPALLESVTPRSWGEIVCGGPRE